MLVIPPALLLGDVDHLQSYRVFLPPVAVVDVKHHHRQVVVVVVLLMVGLVLLPPPSQRVTVVGDLDKVCYSPIYPVSLSGPVGVPLGPYLYDAIKRLKDCDI